MHNATRYPFSVLRDPIDSGFHGPGRRHAGAMLAWTKLKALAGLIAHIEYDGDPGGDDSHDLDAISWAWEDVAMAFRGFGDNTVTGPILEMWRSLPDAARDDLCDRIDRCLFAIETLCDASAVRRRYPVRYRVDGVPRDAGGFTLPVALPVGGRYTRAWAHDQGRDPDATEEAIRDSLLSAEVYRDLDRVDSAVSEGLELGDESARRGTREAQAAVLRAGFFVVPLDPPGEC